jgi:hypothetical protein
LVRLVGHASVVVVLTVLTQLGGLIWIASRWFRRPVLVFALAYAGVWGAVQVVAPMAGRVALPCFGAPLRSQSVAYCALMRNFVEPELKVVAEAAAAAVASQFPGTVTLALDGGFPFADGFPLLPHLSHDDGEKLDLAFFYAGPAGAYVPGRTRSPLGYFAFETPGEPETCPPVWLTTRWRIAWLQPLLPDLRLEAERTAALVRVLLADVRVGKVFVEPALARDLGLSDAKLRFQGCRAARHDDHVHVQLAP